MFGIVSAIAILLVTVIYAACLCLHYRSSLCQWSVFVLLANVCFYYFARGIGGEVL